MFPWFNSARFYRPNMMSWLTSRLFRVMFGLIFVYVGINLAGDLVKSDSKANEPIKAMVHKYDAAEIVSIVASDVGHAIENSFSKNGQPTTISGANQQAKEVSASLEGRFREKIPAVHSAFQEILEAVFIPIKGAIQK